MAIVEHAPPAPPRSPRGRRPPKPIFFPTSSEDYVGETKRHLNNRTALYLALKDVLAATATIGSEQFVYWDPQNKRICLCPDVLVKLGVPDSEFTVWNSWETGALDLGVEITSPADLHDRDWNAKLSRYRAAGVREVVRYDHEADQPLRVWDRTGGDLVERSPGDPELRFCRTLGMWWTYVRERGTKMLRLARDSEGRDLLLTPSEAALKAEAAIREAERARRKAEKERDALAAELERLKASLGKKQRGR